MNVTRERGMALAETLLGTSLPTVKGDLRRQAAIVVWLMAAACVAAVLAPDQQWTFTPMVSSIVLGVVTAWRERGRGANAAVAIAVGRVGIVWAVIAAFVACGWLVSRLTPIDARSIGGWMAAAAVFAVLGGFLWQRERRQHLGLIGMVAGVLIAFGSILLWATDSADLVVAVLGIPGGLGLLYVSGRVAA